MTQQERTLGWVYFFIELFLLPGLLSWINGLLPHPFHTATLNFIFFSVNFACILMIFHSFLGRSLSAAGKQFWDFLQSSVLGFVAYWVLSMVLAQLIQLLLPGFANVNDQSIAALAGTHYVLMFIGTVILVPTVEETLFRGLIFRGLHGRGRFLAYSVSITAFCLVHVTGYIGSVDLLTLCACILQYIPAGLCLAWAYEKSGSIFAPILIHTAINTIGIYALR